MSGTGQLPQRAIDVSFTLRARSFDEAPGKDTVTLSGLRVSASIANGGYLGSDAEIRIWGMSDSQMAQLSTLGLKVVAAQAQRNLVQMAAGNKGDTLATVFRGVIVSAWQNFDAMPDVYFHVIARTSFLDQMLPIPPSSYGGSVDVATVMGNLAQQMGRNFQNWGVTARVSNPYFAGTAYDQAKQLATHAGIGMTIDDATGDLEIWPRDGERGGQIAEVSPDTGMILYPGYTENGIVVRSVFTPNIRWGSLVNIKSDLPRASGKKVVRGLRYTIESEMPGGQWMIEAQCFVPGTVVVPAGY